MDDDPLDRWDGEPNVEGLFLKAFDVDGSVDRFLALPVRGMRLVIACAAFIRLCPVVEWARKANWDNFDEEQWDRGFDSVELYGILREALLTSLGDEPAFGSAHELVQRAFPMPSSAFALAFELVAVEDPSPYDRNSAKATELIRWWTLDLERETVELEDELKRLGVQEGMDPFAPGVNAFLLAEDAIGNVLGNVFDVVEDTWRRKQAVRAAEERSSSPVVRAHVDSSARRSGRRPVNVTYEMAARTWWELVDAYEGLGESRRPNQADLCEHLTAQGHRIGVRTLQSRIQEWQTAKLPWPPARVD
jgi:hypothetical protein